MGVRRSVQRCGREVTWRNRLVSVSVRGGGMKQREEFNGGMKSRLMEVGTDDTQRKDGEKI